MSLFIAEEFVLRVPFCIGARRFAIISCAMEFLIVPELFPAVPFLRLLRLTLSRSVSRSVSIIDSSVLEK